MSRELKYITFKGKELRYDEKTPEWKELAIIFPQEISHKNAAATLFRERHIMTSPDELLGAGFVRWSGMRFVCEGHSETLDLESRGELDAVIINRMLGIEQ